MLKDLEKELKRWREKRATEKPRSSREHGPPAVGDRRTVNVNGQQVVVVKKAKKALP